MNAKHNLKSGIEQQLSSIQMSDHERNAALHAARVAERFVDAIEWVCDKFNRTRADAFVKHNVYYWE